MSTSKWAAPPKRPINGHMKEQGLGLAKDLVRLHVYFSGSVQGVGFRYTAAGIARRYKVTGFVKNLSDGRVELVAEGTSREVGDFVADIEQEMREYIAHSDKTPSEATSEFPSFRIAF